MLALLRYGQIDRQGKSENINLRLKNLSLKCSSIIDGIINDNSALNHTPAVKVQDSYAMAWRCVSYLRLVNKRILRWSTLSNKTFTCPQVTTGFTSSSVPTRKEKALTMPVGKMRDNYSAGN